LKNRLIASTGLAFYANRDDTLTGLIEARLDLLGLRDCSSYSSFLDQGDRGGVEMDLLTAQLTIGETYFFRDEDQFAAIRDRILPDILERNHATKQLRIWSAGCASGAEPYSLTILLAREMPDRIAGWHITIDATDLNRSYLAEAEAGRFREWALRCTSDEIRHECFSNEGSVWTIHPRYKQWVSFHRVNLAESEFGTPWPPATCFDLIVCRNVMIYFSPEVNRRLVGRFYRSLGDGGWLIVGPAESNLENYKAFRTSTGAGARCFQKVAPSAPRETIAEPVAGPLEADALSGIGELRRLADLGDWEGAADYGEQLSVQDRLNPAVHFYRAMIFESLGKVPETERALRQAIYLDRKFALAHYQLGVLLKRNLQTGEAVKAFDNTLRTLAGLPGGQAVPGGPDMTVADLLKLAKTHLEKSSLSG
jgi:chemotaxis protein methyltransferase CheR